MLIYLYMHEHSIIRCNTRKRTKKPIKNVVNGVSDQPKTTKQVTKACGFKTTTNSIKWALTGVTRMPNDQAPKYKWNGA